jgi:hypothetical protein
VERILCAEFPSGLPGGPIVLEALSETRIDMNPGSINSDKIEEARPTIILNDLLRHIKLTITVIIKVIEIHHMLLDHLSAIQNLKCAIPHGTMCMSKIHAKKTS